MIYKFGIFCLIFRGLVPFPLPAPGNLLRFVVLFTLSVPLSVLSLFPEMQNSLGATREIMVPSVG